MSRIASWCRWPMSGGTRGVRRALAAGVAGVAAAAVLAPAAWASAAAWPASEREVQPGKKVLQLPMRTDGPKSLDPAEGSTQYDNIACSQVYETLLTFKYQDPKTLEPLLLAEMPKITDNADGTRTIAFKLRADARFHDSPAFKATGGKGRAVTSEDVFYSLKRLADKRLGLKNWWLFDGAVKGFDEFKEAQNKGLDSGAGFNYDAPVAGFVKKSESEFEIVLNKPVHRFLYVLAQFQTSVVPREAVEAFGSAFQRTPVGTGPFVFDAWQPKQFLHLNRNPNYREVVYPAREEWSREDRRRRLDRAAGQRVPFVDRMEFSMFVQDQPMWLEFGQGKLGYIEVPNDFFEQGFDKRTKEVKPELAAKGVTAHSDVLLDFIFIGFNMMDPTFGGLTPERRALRQAVHLAIDHGEINEAFYQGINVIYDGPIPVGLDGHPEGGRAPVSFQGPELDRARAKLVEAGWPGGKNAKTGEPLVLRYYTSNGTIQQQQAEMMKRQVARIGVQFEPVLLDFSTLIENVNNKKAPAFGFAWGSDYPDGENNLALFYGPNESPGSNHYNYKNPEYDKLYEKILPMAPSPERTKLYEQMRDMLINDTPYVGSMGRTRFYLMAPWIVNCRPTERTWSWLKYLDVDDSKRGG